MATISAPTASANSSPMPPSRSTGPSSVPPPGTPLWQAPVFVLGVAALVAVWFGRPLWPDSLSRRVERDLASVRQLLDRPDGDVEYALKLATRALEASDTLPDRLAEAAFLLGSAHLRMAEKSDPLHGRDAWQRARTYFEQAQRAGLAEAEQPILLYRLARTIHHLEDDPAKTIPLLEQAAPKADNRAEAYTMLTQAYLRLNPPDLARALVANQQLRDVPEATEAELASAKLLGGEIQLRMGKPEEARKSLEKIGESAPPAILARARLLRARTYQEQKQWGEASRLYTAVLADTRAPIPEPGVIYYDRGLCHRSLEQPNEAARDWQECINVSRGPEGPAAALLLAESRLADPATLEEGLKALTAAVARVTTPEAWKNPLYDLGRTRELFERAFTVFRQGGKHDLAVQLLEPYARIALPRRVLVLRGEVTAEWARARMESGKPASEVEQQARDLYRQAAAAHASAAELAGLTPAERGDHVWASAQNWLAAREGTRALEAFKQCIKLNLEPARLGEAWYHLGELHREAKNPQTAGEAYRKCLEYDTRFAFRARHQLAMKALQAGDLDGAEQDLVYNVKMMRWEADLEAQSQSLFALGNLLYQKRSYRGVVSYLEHALGRFKADPEVARARYQLADSYRQIAAQENQSFLLGESMSADTRAHFQKEHRRWLQKAADEFAILEKFLDTPEGKDQLTPDLRGQVPFITAKCWFNLGQYDKALVIWEKLIERYPSSVEGLDALGGAVSCHAALGQIDKVKQRLLQIRTMLPQFAENVRKPWEAWLVEALKPLKDA